MGLSKIARYGYRTSSQSNGGKMPLRSARSVVRRVRSLWLRIRCCGPRWSSRLHPVSSRWRLMGDAAVLMLALEAFLGEHRRCWRLHGDGLELDGAWMLCGCGAALFVREPTHRVPR